LFFGFSENGREESEQQQQQQQKTAPYVRRFARFRGREYFGIFAPSTIDNDARRPAENGQFRKYARTGVSQLRFVYTIRVQA